MNAGVLYPDMKISGCPGHINHQHLGEAFDGRLSCAAREEALASIETQLIDVQPDVCILSYESLYKIWGSAHAAHVLSELFARHGYSMEAFLTVRATHEQLNSLYVHDLQFLEHHTAFRAWLGYSPFHPDFDYSRHLRPWIKACGGRLTVSPLLDQQSSDAPVRRYLEAMELPFLALDQLAGQFDVQANRSPGSIACEIMRRLAVAGAREQATDCVRTMTSWVEQRVDEAGIAEERFNALDEDLADLINRHHRAGNDALARRAWGCNWAQRVKAAPLGPITELAAIDMTADQEDLVEGVVEDALRHFGLKRLSPAERWRLRLSTGTAGLITTVQNLIPVGR